MIPKIGERYLYDNYIFVDVLSDFIESKFDTIGNIDYKYKNSGIHKQRANGWSSKIGRWKKLIGQEAE